MSGFKNAKEKHEERCKRETDRYMSYEEMIRKGRAEKTSKKHFYHKPYATIYPGDSGEK